MAGFFWGLSLENTLDRGGYTLEEILEEDDVIQGCKCSNTRLISFLQEREQVKRMVDYVRKMPPEGADHDKFLKYSFVSCAVLTSEVDDILKTLVEDEELMDSLFSFLDPEHERRAALTGYFGKVVICLVLRKTERVMRYIQSHQEILKRLVDLVGVTSISEVLLRLVGADDQIYTFNSDAVQWLSETNLLEMLVDKLSSENSSEVHANAANTLCAVMRLPQSALALKLSNPRFLTKLVNQALENPASKSTLVHSLSVCISVIEPKRAAVCRIQTEQSPTASPETVEGMLQRLGDIIKLLDVSNDRTVLPTTYGELKPPFGTHRLKIVEFLGVLLKADHEKVGKVLIQHKAIQCLIQQFFDYPFNNMLHHHVESVILTCIESNTSALIENIFEECDFLGKLLALDRNPISVDSRPEARKKGKPPPRVGSIGHLTRIANKLAQVENQQVQAYLKANRSWVEWSSTVLQERNAVENVYQWACGRPMPVQSRPMDSDEDDFRDRDYDVSSMVNNLTHEVFRYGMFDSEDAEEDVFFDGDPDEVVINSLHLTDEQESARLFGANSLWFSFQGEVSRMGSSPSKPKEGHTLNFSLASSGSSSSDDDDEVVVGEEEDDELLDTATSPDKSQQLTRYENGDTKRIEEEEARLVSITLDLEAVDLVGPKEESSDTVTDCVGQNQESSDYSDRETETRAFSDQAACNGVFRGDREIIKDVKQLTGVEPEGTTKAMEKAFREGIVGEAAPLHLPGNLG